MAELVSNSDAPHLIDEMVLKPAPKPDRLPPMLFLAALVHGILIIGVTFNAVLNDEFSKAISLEVTILAEPDKSVTEPENAQFLAQASQEGVGNTTESVRPTAPLESNAPIDNAGNPEGSSLDESTAQAFSADQVLASETEQSLSVEDIPREQPKPEESTAIALEAGIEVTLPLPQSADSNLQIKDDNPRRLITSVDTRESKIAGYLDRWKRKIETIGVSYFPDRGVTQGIAGSPTLEVTIDASGQLQEVSVRQGSGSRVLDQAALSILRRAAPFDPFPDAIRADYDELRFAYKWQFSEAGETATARAD